MIDKFKDKVQFDVEKRDVDGDDFPVYHIQAKIGLGGDRYAAESEVESSKRKILEDLEKMFLSIGITQEFVDLVFKAGYEQGNLNAELDIPPVDSFLI